jgi:hypothetical protein
LAVALSLKQTLKLAEADLARSEEQTAELRTVVDGLRAALARYQGADAPRPVNGVLGRTDAVLAVLSEQPTTALSVRQIGPLVGSKRGTVEDPDAISAALSHLKNQHKVRSSIRGYWMLSGITDPDEPADDNDDADDVAPAPVPTTYIDDVPF